MKAGALAVAALLAAFSFSAAAQGVVRDRSLPDAAPRGSEARALFLRLQALERQILSLQGMVEELDNKLDLARALQRDRISQLERRLAMLQGSNAPAGNRGGDIGNGPAKSLYRDAYSQMQQRAFDQAKRGFERYVAEYPEGGDLANALFWLGELSLVVTPQTVAQAQHSFQRIIKEHPDFKGMSTVLFKMAKIYHSQGNGVMARTLLKRVIREYGQSNSNASELAQAYLDENFPAGS